MHQWYTKLPLQKEYRDPLYRRAIPIRHLRLHQLVGQRSSLRRITPVRVEHPKPNLYRPNLLSSKRLHLKSRICS